MTVLDDIRSNTEASHEAFDEAQTLVKQASDEASELEQSAAGHGWAAVAVAMSAAREALDEAAARVDDAMTAAFESITELSGITDEASSDEVARRFADIGQNFETARAAASQALESLDDARTSAEEADAQNLVQQVDGAQEILTKGRATLAAAITDVAAQQAEASTWGKQTGAAPKPIDDRPETGQGHLRRRASVPTAQTASARDRRRVLQASSSHVRLPLPAKGHATSVENWSFTEVGPPAQPGRTRTSTSRCGWTTLGSTS